MVKNTGPIVPESIIKGTCVLFMSVVGSLMYAMLGTYPNLAYTVGVLGRHTSNPGEAHWKAAKYALHYLQFAKDQVLTYTGDNSSTPSFIGYSNADWSGDGDTSCSTSGYVFMFCGAVIGWSSKQQSLIAMSSMESEYIGLANAGMHLSWLHMFFKDIGLIQRDPNDLYCDNQGALTVCKDLEYCACTKHIQRKYHSICDDVIGKGLAIVWYIPTSEMVVDILTKALSHNKHSKFTTAMGLQPHSSGSVRI